MNYEQSFEITVTLRVTVLSATKLPDKLNSRVQRYLFTTAGNTLLTPEGGQ